MQKEMNLKNQFFQMFFFQIKKNNKMATKVGLLLLLVIMIFILPEISNTWSQEVGKLGEPEADWDESWREEWQGTQVMVFELPDGELKKILEEKYLQTLLALNC